METKAVIDRFDIIDEAKDKSMENFSIMVRFTKKILQRSCQISKNTFQNSIQSLKLIVLTSSIRQRTNLWKIPKLW